MICDKCGAKVENGAEFCWACGSKIEVDNTVNENVEENLLTKYKNNISFFHLSDDKDVKESVESENNNDVPFVFPDNISQEFDGQQVGLDQNEVISEDSLISEPIFPENTQESANDQNSDNQYVFSDNSLNIFGGSQANLVQDGNNGEVILPDSVSSSSALDTPVLPQASNFGDGINSNVAADEQSNIIQNENPDNSSPLSNDAIIEAPIFPEGTVQNDGVIFPDNILNNSTSNEPVLPQTPLDGANSYISSDEQSNIIQNGNPVNNSPLSNDAIIETPIFPENTVQNDGQVISEDSSSRQGEVSSTEVNNNSEDKKSVTKEKKKTNNNLIVFIAIAFIALVVVAVIVTNNDSKQIVCVQTEVDNGMSSETIIDAGFKNNKIKSLSLSGNYTIDSAYSNVVDKLYESVKEELKKYESVKGVEISTNNDNNVITYAVTSNNAKALFKAAFSKDNDTAEEFTNAAEEQGYKCTVNKN